MQNGTPVVERSLAAGATLAEYPADKRPPANAHTDRSGRGNWTYLSSRTLNPTLPDADRKLLRWNNSRKSYLSPRGAKGNDKPAIGGSLEPSPLYPVFVDLRWKSGVTADVRIQGDFHKFANAKFGNGTRAHVFVGGQQKFAGDLKLKDDVGIDFDFRAT